jgi:hypothetical protein
MKTISVVPVSISYTLVPEAELLIKSFHNSTIAPPSSLFHDIQSGDDAYKSFKPVYTIKTDFPFIRAFAERRAPVFCTICNPVSLKENRGIALEQCFESVKQNLKILPHHFISKLILSDPEGISRKWKASGTEGIMKAGQALRDKLPKIHTDISFYNDDGLSDIISIGMEILRSSDIISGDGSIRNKIILEYYSNKMLF